LDIQQRTSPDTAFIVRGDHPIDSGTPSARGGLGSNAGNSRRSDNSNEFFTKVNVAILGGVVIGRSAC
jgi:hypothetical protein